MVKFRLKEVVNSIVSGITINHCSKGTYPVYGSTGIIGYTNTHDYSGERILIARVGANAGATNIVCGEYGVSDNTLVITVDSEYETKYIYYYLKHKKLNQFVFGSSQPLITGSLLKNISLYIPDKMSQQHIVKALSDVDGVISSLEKLIAKYKSIKAACLQQMFPQNGETVPRMRLPGFTGAWEQRELSEGVSEIGDGLHGTPIYCEDGNVYFINGNNLVDGKILIGVETKKVNESQQSMADKPLDDTTILMSINGTIGNLAYYSGEKLMLGKSAAYIKVSEFDKRFVYAYLQAPSVQGYFMDSLTGTTIKNLGLKAIREMIMPIPQDVDEQKRIGEFFDTLDHLITLHQRKLKKVQKIKQGMMQQLLTGKIRLV